MDEKLIVGAILGVMLIIVWTAIDVGKRLAQAQSEGARRLKLVLKLAAAGVLATIMVGLFGPVGTLITCGVAGVIFWIYKGFRK